jgi:hypothetical protein
MRRSAALKLSALLGTLLTLLPVGATAIARDWRSEWATLRNERHGFLIAYPVRVFQQDADPTTDEGRVLSSVDGKARLLVGAFANEEQTSLEAYREFLLNDQYAGAEIEYAPVHAKWFVLSGTLGEQEFYERVSFTCGGRLINSWVMIYPKAQSGLYDRVVEAIARTYSPGAGRSGNCD